MFVQWVSRIFVGGTLSRWVRSFTVSRETIHLKAMRKRSEWMGNMCSLATFIGTPVFFCLLAQTANPPITYIEACRCDADDLLKFKIIE